MTISRDGTAYLWNTDTGKRDIQLHFSAEHEDESLFRFRNCKYVFDLISLQKLYSNSNEAMLLLCYLVMIVENS